MEQGVKVLEADLEHAVVVAMRPVVRDPNLGFLARPNHEVLVDVLGVVHLAAQRRVVVERGAVVDADAVIDERGMGPADRKLPIVLFGYAKRYSQSKPTFPWFAVGTAGLGNIGNGSGLPIVVADPGRHCPVAHGSGDRQQVRLPGSQHAACRDRVDDDRPGNRLGRRCCWDCMNRGRGTPRTSAGRVLVGVVVRLGAPLPGRRHGAACPPPLGECCRVMPGAPTPLAAG